MAYPFHRSPNRRPSCAMPRRTRQSDRAFCDWLRRARVPPPPPSGAKHRACRKHFVRAAPLRTMGRWSPSPCAHNQAPAALPSESSHSTRRSMNGTRHRTLKWLPAPKCIHSTPAKACRAPYTALRFFSCMPPWHAAIGYSARNVVLCAFPSLYKRHNYARGRNIARGTVTQAFVAQNRSAEMHGGALEFYKSGDIDGLVSGQILREDALAMRSVSKVQRKAFEFAKDAERSRGVMDVQVHLAGRQVPRVSRPGSL